MNKVDTSSNIRKTFMKLGNTHDLQDGRVTTDNEGQAAKTFNAMSDTHRQLFMQVSGTALQNMIK